MNSEICNTHFTLKTILYMNLFKFLAQNIILKAGRKRQFCSSLDFSKSLRGKEISTSIIYQENLHMQKYIDDIARQRLISRTKTDSSSLFVFNFFF